MAHWIIRDHGFAGQDYKCSVCGEVFVDLYRDIKDTCPSCGVAINEDENEYPDETPEDTPEVHMLTNKEAAAIISGMISTVRFARGSTVSMRRLRTVEVLCKAVKVLENTPD